MTSSIYTPPVLFVFLAIFNGLTAAQICSQTAGNFTANGTYAGNRARLFSSFSSNLSSTYGFFMNTTVGHGADKIYGSALCRADSTRETCNKCVNTGIKQLTDRCPNQIEAINWAWESSFPCIVRYSNSSFIGKLELSPRPPILFNTGEFASGELERFESVWENHTTTLIAMASAGTKIKYASGDANLKSFEKIYATVQCTPDLSRSDCDYCLAQIVTAFNSCCIKNKGGYSHNPNCIFRWDMYPFYNSFTDFAPPPANPPATLLSPPPANTTDSGNGRISSRTVLLIAVPLAVAFSAAVAVVVIFRRMKQRSYFRSRLVAEERSNSSRRAECMQFNLAAIRIATNNFSDLNKLGEGGFGPVYKGVLSDGEVIAVKRLSKNSKQGEIEFKNEVICVARLQHRNLVRLLGFCVQGIERLLIYEFLPKSSLDHLVFDANKRGMLDWETRRSIIAGIARGLLYLHEDSQLRIVHRDLKASNVLLDEKMNPKISDFGMAKLFESEDQTRDTTSRIVGTYGYMAPEYAIHGRFSTKSDVYSFGVLLLEIITGETIRRFRGGADEQDLVNYAWSMWNKGTALELIDPTMPVAGSTSDVTRCIHIALLCVQENAGNRPTMASVLLMLSSSSLVLSRPARPAYALHSTTHQYSSSSWSSSSHTSHSASSKSSGHDGDKKSSRNQVSISEFEPR
ncbi:unnamed protein product [Cuscuta campestris]|uniref:Protein kinase domain-containing protein n=1 Tax=Cuscuta campestris TaxID=132261 RepID=A0A484KQA5_9ASTE|nr:unnamed protein product [Cuscuta campestris]